MLPEGEGGWPGNLPCPRRAGCNSLMLWSSRSKASCFAEDGLVCYEYNAMLLTVLEMCLLPNTLSAMPSLSVVSGHPLSVSSEATGCLSTSVGRGRSSGPDPESQTRRSLTLSPPGPLPLLLRAWSPPWLRTSVGTRYLTECACRDPGGLQVTTPTQTDFCKKEMNVLTQKSGGRSVFIYLFGSVFKHGSL